MYVFLIFSSLGVAFYVVLLAELYRDDRQRRQLDGITVRRVNLGAGVEVDSTGVLDTASAAARRGNSPERMLWVPVTMNHWKAPSRTTSGNPPKLVRLAAPVGGKGDMQCG